MERGSKNEIPPSASWVYTDGRLTCDGVSLDEIGARFGTPTFVYLPAGTLSSDIIRSTDVDSNVT